MNMVTLQFPKVQNNAQLDKKIEISVCVCTYKRPSLLSKLLDSLSSQRCDLAFEVVVVDNDPMGSGGDAVNAARQAHPHLKLRYEIESNKGISFARNTAVSMATGAFVAWIDDDETATVDWLNKLSLAQKVSDADALFGPVLPIFPENSPPWTKRGGLFDRPRHQTGAPIDAREARTGNAFVKASWLRLESPPFDISLANTGGEDFDFFTRIEAKGAQFKWCDEAEVFELVPLERQRLSWILERRLRSSAHYWRSQPAPFVVGAVRGLVGAALFLVLSLVGVIAAPFGFHRAVKVWGRAMGSLGRAVAISGITWKGY